MACRVPSGICDPASNKTLLLLAQVSARAEARAVGLRVLRRAAAERAREEAAAQERRLVSMQLHHLGDASQAALPAASSKGHSFALTGLRFAGRHSIVEGYSGCCG